MGKLIVDRDLLESPLSGMEFAAYLSAADMGTVYRDKVVLLDITIYYNLMGAIPNSRQRAELNEALLRLMDAGVLSAEVVGRGLYLIDCGLSFKYDLDKLPHGASTLEFESVRKIVAESKCWQGMLRYYLMVLSHQRVSRACIYSRQYFSDKLGISALTLSKYNTALEKLGVMKVVRRKNTTSVYKIT